MLFLHMSLQAGRPLCEAQADRLFPVVYWPLIPATARVVADRRDWQEKGQPPLLFRDRVWVYGVLSFWDLPLPSMTVGWGKRTDGL